jgi:hypothetical protein
MMRRARDVCNDAQRILARAPTAIQSWMEADKHDLGFLSRATESYFD